MKQEEQKELLKKALFGYLPYNPKIKFIDSDEVFGITFESMGQWSNDMVPMATLEYTFKSSDPIGWKLLLRPLSDYQDINSSAMNELNIDIQDQIVLEQFALGEILLSNMPYGIVEMMKENHIDFNDLITDNLAITN